MHARYGAAIYGQYGFLDSFNPTLTAPGGPALLHGRIVPGLCWVDGDYLGIDQGPIVAMIANHRDGFIWNADAAQPLRWSTACAAPASPAAGWTRGVMTDAARFGCGRWRRCRCCRRLHARRDAAGSTCGRWARRRRICRRCSPRFPAARPRDLRIQPLPWSAAHEKLLTGYAGGSLPDLGQVGNSWIAELTAIGAIQPVPAGDAVAGRRPVRRRWSTPTASAAS